MRSISLLPDVFARIIRTGHRLADCRRGNITVLTTLSLFGLASMAGAAVTVSQMTAVSTELQDRADSLALGATLAVHQGADEGTVADKAESTFNLLGGGVEGSGGAAVEIVSRSPAETTATIARDVNVLFGALVGMDTVRIERSAHAIATGGEPVCLHVLSASQPAAFSRRGAAALEAENCVAQVNSVSEEAVDSRGGAGGVTTLRTLVSGGGSRVSGFDPAPEYHAPPVRDPYASALDWPDDGPCDSAGYRVKRDRRIIEPGVICGDLQLETGAEVVLSPGVHVVTGDLTMRAGASLIAEDAVLVFIGETSRLDLDASAEARFAAPTQGQWAGIAVAIKPQPVEQTSSIHGGGSIDLTGVFYMPTQQLHLTGGGRLGEPTDELRMIVVNRLDLRGDGRLWLNGQGSPVSTAAGLRLVR